MDSQSDRDVVSDVSISSEHGYDSTSSEGSASSTEEKHQSAVAEKPKQRKSQRKFLNNTRELRSLWKSLEHLEAEDLAKTLYNLHAIKRLSGIEHATSSSRRNSRRRRSTDSVGEKRAVEDDWKEWKINRRQVTAWPAESSRVPRLGERHTNKKSGAWMADDDPPKNALDVRKFLRGSRKWIKDELCSFALADIRGRLRSDHHKSAFQPLSMELDEDQSYEKLTPTIERAVAKSDQLLARLRQLRVQHFGKLYTPSYIIAPVENDTSIRPQGTTSKRARSVDSMECRGRTRRRKSAEDNGSGRSSSIGHVDKDLIETFRHRLIDSGLPNTIRYSEYQSSSRIISSLVAPFTDQEKGDIRVDLAKIAYRDYKHAAKLGIMDWRHVLGLAASKGWDAAILSKAKQRCNALFGKQMRMNTIPPAENEPPAKVAEADQETASAYSDSELDLFEDWKLDTKAGALFTSAEPKQGPQLPTMDLDPDPRACPWDDCPRHDTPYDSAWRLREHMKHVHGVRGMEAVLDTEFLSGLHRDGFLQPVSTWRQSDVRPRNEQT